jgi:hypothetical protein
MASASRILASHPLYNRSTVRRLVSSVRVLPPHGWWDVVRQFSLFLLVYQGYQVVRGLADGTHAAAYSNADDVIELERSLGTFFEADLQQALLSQTWLIDFANWMYLNSHYLVTTTFLVWLYFFRNENFRFVRNMFLVAMGIALIGYALYPTAPPRFIPAAGFTDTVGAFTNTDPDSGLTSFLVNQYAAVPSMHIAFALMIAVPGLSLCRSVLMRAWWSLYPLLVFFVVVVTANHYWFDAATGAAVACLAAVAAHQLARLRPESWSWREAAEEATA